MAVTVGRKRPSLIPVKLDFIEPMHALAVQNLPEGNEWLYEVKFDGYRCLVGKDHKQVTLWSEGGAVCTSQFPHIAKACERLPTGTLLDGEIVAVDERGRISFNLLQHRRSQAQALLFYGFDVLINRGNSLLEKPLKVRREVLQTIFARGISVPLSIPAKLEASPAQLVRAARQFGFEGIIAKRKDSQYESGKRSGAWVKYLFKGQEVAIGAVHSE